MAGLSAGTSSRSCLQFLGQSDTHQIGSGAEQLAQLDVGRPQFGQCQADPSLGRLQRQRLALAPLELGLEHFDVQAAQPVRQTVLAQHREHFGPAANIAVDVGNRADAHVSTIIVRRDAVAGCARRRGARRVLGRLAEHGRKRPFSPPRAPRFLGAAGGQPTAGLRWTLYLLTHVRLNNSLTNSRLGRRSTSATVGLHSDVQPFTGRRRDWSDGSGGPKIESDSRRGEGGTILGRRPLPIDALVVPFENAP